MSLRARLTLFFVAIVVLPVAVATAYSWQAVARSSQRQVQTELANDPALLQAMAAGDSAILRAVLRAQRCGRSPAGRDRARRPGARPGRPPQPRVPARRGAGPGSAAAVDRATRPGRGRAARVE
ncbi:MAG TPA: hypothetical protein VFJ69_04855 [Actinomycetota bacterium]|nr:hypothetical protein [Actinomycetota bacterium]